VLLGIHDQHPWPTFFLFVNDSEVDRATVLCRQVVGQQTLGTCKLHMRKADGTPFFAALQVMPVTVGEGAGERIQIAFQDITCRKERDAQLRRQESELEATRTRLRELAAQRFTAQREERQRIARDLHDDHCQRITVLIMDANMVAKACSQQSPDLAARLAVVSTKLTALLNDVRTRSHDLLRQ